MKVEAIKVENGFLIPFNETLEKIKEDRIIIDLGIIEDDQLEKGYAILDELVGICESNRTDASVNHDAIIYDSRFHKLSLSIPMPGLLPYLRESESVGFDLSPEAVVFSSYVS